MEETTLTPDQYWVNLARDAYTGSTTWFDTNVRSRIISDIRQFQGEHPEGSPYLTDSYRLRSKLFRPKTRAAIRKGEAEAVAAYFASEDVANVRPVDDNDPMEVAAAKFHKALLQYRLSRPAPAGLPWFLTLAGGVQDALAVGVVCSYQDWKLNAAKGLDRPDVTLLPPENYRFHPASDWRDVVNTSPYFVILWPMYVKDVRAKMDKPPKLEVEAEDASQMPEVEEIEAAESPVEGEEEAAKGKVWRYYPDSQIKSAGMPVDTIRQAREKGTDSKESQSISDFDIVWVHQNFMEIDGVDVCFYTLGTEHLLSDPVPVTEKYPQGRPVVVGFSIVEAHKAYKPSVATLTRDTQTEINHVANLRIDATKIGLRPPMLVKRGAQVDLRALTRRGQGTNVLVSDTNSDVKPMMQDTATVASYQEQDRLNLDFDDIAGAFSGSSVASNRKLNETVGGMNLLSSNANAVSEYQLRTINETWVEGVLRQIIMLEQHYETDPVVLMYAAKQADIEIPPNTPINAVISDEFMKKDVILNVSIGTGSANPQTQLERFVYGISSLAKFTPQALEKINSEEVVKELFGKLGYKDGTRFFNFAEEGQDPEKEQMAQMIQQLQAALDAKNPPEVIAAQVAKLEAEARKIDLDAKLKEVEAVAKRVEALFSAMNTAQVAVQTPLTMPVADAIAASAGFVDQDAPPIYPEVPFREFGMGEGEPVPESAIIPKNTSPNFPANPDVGMMEGIEGVQP